MLRRMDGPYAIDYWLFVVVVQTTEWLSRLVHGISDIAKFYSYTGLL